MFESKFVKNTSVAITSAVALSGLSLKPSQAEGAALTSMSLYDQSKALSTDPMYQWAGAVRRVDSTGTLFASMVMIAPDVFLTAGHFTPRDNSTTASLTDIFFGANYHTTNVSYAVSHTMRFPTYVFGDSSTIDLGIGWTSNFVAGFNTPVTFSSLAMGEVGTMVDYGNIGDPSTGEMPSLGDRMAGYAPKSDLGGSSPYPESLYDFLEFDGDGSLHVDPNIQGLNGSSGAPWYDSEGNLTNLLTAKTNGISIGDSVALKLENPDIQAVLQPIIQDSWNRHNVPEPDTTTFGLMGGVSLISLRRRRS